MTSNCLRTPVMKRHLFLCLLLPVCGVALSSCNKSNEPGPAYYLTTEELAWQGYQLGQQLRFGQAGSSRVRTYAVVEVIDRLEEGYQPVWIASVQGQLPTYQHITVKGYRTDSASYVVASINSPKDSVREVDTFLDLQKYAPNHDPAKQALLSRVGWGTVFTADPQLQAVTTGQSLAANGNVTMLPTFAVGGITYGPTLQIVRGYKVSPGPKQQVTNQIWFAKGRGVVAFEEQASGLWYRLP